VHKGEYVVPQEGALVIRSDNTEQHLKRMVQLLERLVEMVPGRVNATIVTKEEKVEVKDVLEARSKVRTTRSKR